MERYHIFKLGLAIIFYAAYCIRPMLVYSLEADNELDNNHFVQNADHEFFQYFQGVDGRPGLDFPVYSFIPRTAFSCKGIQSGYYADLDTDCQVFHICEEGKKISFLCPNGTIFQQSDLICEWWNKVNCTDSPSLYAESAERLQNDIARRKLGRRVQVYDRSQNNNHGAIMRMEERSSVRAIKNGKDYPINSDIDLRQQRTRNHKVPDNNDIEQQIEQAESNNRHLANNFNNQQQTRHPNHNYNNYQEPTTIRSRQIKKDIDKNTGNYINNNYHEQATSTIRHSKRVQHGQQNNFVHSSKNNGQEKSTTLKEYHVQFGSTSATEKYNKNSFRTTTKNFQQQQQFSNNNQYFDQDNKNDKFGARTSPRVQQNSFNTLSTTFKNIIQSSTTQATTTTTEEFPYGSGIKEKFQSYDARTTRKPEVNAKSTNQKSRGSVKNNVLPIYGQSIPVTTYSPPVKYSFNSQDDNFALPPFPKHKSEQQSVNPIVSSKVASKTIPSGQIPVHVGQNSESEETQVPQESASFVKNSFNSITDNAFKSSPSPYPNHRSTYSDIKEFSSLLEPPKISSISSITPHLVTTQPINNGKPFIGSRVGNTLPPNHPTTQSKYTYLPTSTTKPTVIFGVIRHSTTQPTPYGPPQPLNTKDSFENTPNSFKNIFNVGNTDKSLPTIETTTAVTNALPTEIFNTGSTDTTLKPNIVPKQTTVPPPFRISVPEQGTLNVGQNYDGLQPVNEPPFVKKTVPLLYTNKKSTERTVDHATVYGSYPTSTQRNFASKNTPYSPTVPTVTQRSLATSTTTYTFNQGVPIKFDNGQDKISIQLSKNVGGHNNIAYGDKLQPQQQKLGALLRFSNQQPSSSVPQNQRTFATSGLPPAPKSKTEKPRPFSKSLQFEDQFNKGTTINDGVSSSFPSYHISSARPFGISETTPATPTVTTPSTGDFSVYDNVDNMIGVLQEIASYNSQRQNVKEEARPGLSIPPSVGPQTLHSLAQYFANEFQNNETHGETKEKLTTLLTAMTVHGYNNLFNVGSTSTAATSTLAPETTTLTSSRFGNEETNNIDGENKNDPSGDDDLLSTTAIPELRQLARNFSLALSSYLNDPDNFRKTLESLRPSEPPPLDNVDSSTTEDELLNFSDADLKPSTTAPMPSATWAAILAAEAQKNPFEDVKNSLNPDLNTADSQSFVPKFNSVQVNEKQGKGFTELPPNHWTSSPQVTKLWQNTLKVNPVSVNDHFVTTPSSLLDEETTEPELFNSEEFPELQPQSEISYDLRELPPLALNSTQVHGILIDFMNHTNEQNRLHRILKKLNTSENEFLDRMKEIESNPLTKRLILLLISECGANITKDLGLPSDNESLTVSASALTERRNAENHPLGQLVHPHLTEEDQDTRALQLLNSLYTIASRFGRKR